MAEQPVHAGKATSSSSTTAPRRIPGPMKKALRRPGLLLTSCGRQFLMVRRLSCTETRYAFRREEPRSMIAKNILKSTLSLALAGLLSTFCLPANGQSAKTAATSPATPKISPIPGFDTSVMDTSADPCADFYKFACGKFAQKYPIPGDLPLYDQFENLNEYN